MARRAQMEMVGLVFVVLIIVVGIVLYMTFSGRTADGAQSSKQTQAYVSFITAFGETDIPDCGVSAARVAQECAMGERSLCGGDPCGALDAAMEAVAQGTLDPQGAWYNFSLTGTGYGDENGCKSASPSQRIRFASLPVGAGQHVLRLSVCTR